MNWLHIFQWAYRIQDSKVWPWLPQSWLTPLQACIYSYQPSIQEHLDMLQQWMSDLFWWCALAHWLCSCCMPSVCSQHRPWQQDHLLHHFVPHRSLDSGYRFSFLMRSYSIPDRDHSSRRSSISLYPGTVQQVSFPFCVFRMYGN